MAEALGNPARRLHTPEEEQAIADFFKDNPCFYDKSHQDFRNKPRKDGLLHTFARQLGGGWTSEYNYLIYAFVMCYSVKYYVF